MRPLFSRLLGALAILVLTLVAASMRLPCASAHAPLVSSNPTDLQVLTSSPAQMTLTFNGAFAPTPGTFAFVTCGGNDVVAGTEAASPNDPATLVVPLMAGIPNGKCNVFWKSTAADDGGVTFGRYSFFVGPTNPSDVSAAQPGTSIAVPDDATQNALNPSGTMPSGSSQGSSAAPEIQQTTSTASYSVQLDIGPAVMMSMGSGAMGSMSSDSMSSMGGEIMVPMANGQMPAMALTDQGQPVNHHLEVHIMDQSSGAVDTSVMPTIAIADASGTTRVLTDVTEMYDPSVGQSDLHFGNNVYLADGTYSFMVTIGSEAATFANVAVSGGMGLSASSMEPAGSMMP